MPGRIHEPFLDSASRTPDAIAIEELDGSRLTYRELDALSDAIRDLLRTAGIAPGDRVAFCLPKSADAIAIILGILKAGGAYVPLDPFAPPARNAWIAFDCGVRLLFVDEERRARVGPALSDAGAGPELVTLPAVGGGRGIRAIVEESPTSVGDVAPAATPSEDDVAYIFYTSGSTGRPKGASLTHRNGMTYLDWASEAFEVTGEDRWSLHVPLHFDPSVSDVFLPLKHGACIVPIDDRTGRDPFTLGRLIAEKRLTGWNSVPSVLALIAEHGRLERYDTSALRVVMFGGEVFPVARLRRLRRELPGARMFNLYGPTETNVCTGFEIPDEIPDDRGDPYPIGRPCRYVQARVIGPDAAAVAPGEPGELCVSGPNVMRGYWNRPDLDREVFFEADDRRWYRTGDIVREEDGELVFIGRRDRMVKRRGYRIELGEIAVALHDHPEFVESAVFATSDDDGTRIHAAYVTRDGAPLSIVDLKSYCMDVLPSYMVPDRFAPVDAIPRTSTGKIDYQRLAASV